MKLINILLFAVLAACAQASVPAVVAPQSFVLSSSLLSQQPAPVLQSEEPKVEAVASDVDPMVEVKEFDSGTVKGLIKKLGELDQESHKQIYIKINSYGGSIHWGMELIQYVETLKTPITCVVDWKAYSMGAFMLESDACDKRLMTKRSTILFHEPLVPQASGNAHELRDTADHLDALSKSLIAATAERLKMSEAELTKRIDNKNWTLAYQECLKVKAIDGIVKPSELPPLTEFEKPSFLQMLLGG